MQTSVSSQYLKEKGCSSKVNPINEQIRHSIKKSYLRHDRLRDSLCYPSNFDNTVDLCPLLKLSILPSLHEMVYINGLIR